MSTKKLAKNDLDQIQSIGQRYDELIYITIGFR